MNQIKRNIDKLKNLIKSYKCIYLSMIVNLNCCFYADLLINKCSKLKKMNNKKMYL